MKYDCYKGGKHIGDLKVGSRSVLAVCKGGNPVWRRKYSETVKIGCTESTTAPCDCDNGIRIRIYNARNSHYVHGVTLYHNGVEVVRENVITHSIGDYHTDTEGDYLTPIKAGDIFTTTHSGSGSATVTFYFEGFHAIPKS